MATVVAFHAHPNDEVVLTGGTIARTVAAGHRDHVRVHHVGKRAAELAAVPRVLEVTIPLEMLLRISDLAHLLRLPGPYEADIVDSAYAPRATSTHRINVFRFARQKRDAFAAHRS